MQSLTKFFQGSCILVATFFIILAKRRMSSIECTNPFSNYLSKIFSKTLFKGVQVMTVFYLLFCGLKSQVVLNNMTASSYKLKGDAESERG